MKSAENPEEQPIVSRPDFAEMGSLMGLVFVALVIVGVVKLIIQWWR
ncbi:MAG: hypothetical protein VE98_C0001G0107 [candidate division Kazan bacterium GW2011_GWA1_50_15]|uniref:Uncharacterized protein n=2 Tax=Bacteria division Kazan-3B-28 TaxID=1798534 RepID=A0A0G1X7F0_UNCK3|nr:MAG: hypothetical protein VE98_C0001G0107 [candidate division Kazan bacterium GW2011_GWA1_50_15]KKW25616.1 MAG: hypothetical protein VE99_C0001G0253 [candidate division Kazan bacterium GW2011_GWC1_52_13]KKW26921.1 MAG: hypothetical protein VF00_C0002G0246 [candidate division Kazan bacterium GW2011_GWB1_52_7]